jgi:hypothetical protein
MRRRHASAEVVDVEELAARASGAPDRHLAPPLDLRVVELAEQRRQDVRARQVEVVPGAVQVGRHRRDEVAPVLPAVRLAELDAGDLGDGVRLVGGLERPGQEVFLLHRLRALAGVDAGAAEVQELRDPLAVRRVHHGRVDHHVVVDELGGPGGVGHDAADGAGDEDDVLRPVGREPAVNRGLVAEVKLVPRGGEDVREPARLQAPHDRRADHAGMACDVDSGGFGDVGHIRRSLRWASGGLESSRAP